MPVGAAVGGGAVVSGYLGNEAAKDATAATSAASKNSIAEQRRQFDLTRSDTSPYRDVGAGALNRLAQLFGIQTAPTPGVVDNVLGHIPFTGQRTVQSVGPSASPINSALAESGSATSMPDGGTMVRGGLPIAMQRYGDGPVAAVGRSSSGGGQSLDEILQATPGYQFRLSESEKALERMQAARGYSLAPRAAKELGRYVSDYASGEYGNYLESLFRLSGLGGNAVNTSASAGANAANQISAANQFAGAGAANAGMFGAGSINNAIQGGMSNYMTLQAYNNGMGQINQPNLNYMANNQNFG